MLRKLFETNENWTGTILRFAVGAVMFSHGAQKLLGWFGGYGFEGTMGFLTGPAGLPWIIGLAVIVIEFFGSLSIIAGFASRIWSVGMTGLMTGIILTSHLQNGFFMNWAGGQKGEGFEFHILVIGMVLALFVNGSGKFSIDGLLMHARERNHLGESEHQPVLASAR